MRYIDAKVHVKKKTFQLPILTNTIQKRFVSKSKANPPVDEKEVSEVMVADYPLVDGHMLFEVFQQTIEDYNQTQQDKVPFHVCPKNAFLKRENANQHGFIFYKEEGDLVQRLVEATLIKKRFLGLYHPRAQEWKVFLQNKFCYLSLHLNLSIFRGYDNIDWVKHLNFHFPTLKSPREQKAEVATASFPLIKASGLLKAFLQAMEAFNEEQSKIRLERKMIWDIDNILTFTASDRYKYYNMSLESFMSLENANRNTFIFYKDEKDFLKRLVTLTLFDGRHLDFEHPRAQQWKAFLEDKFRELCTYLALRLKKKPKGVQQKLTKQNILKFCGSRKRCSTEK